MRNTVFAINSTIDGFCDHRDMIADDEVHEYFTQILKQTDVILFGRTTFQLMVPYWPDVARDQSETPAVNEFARTFDRIERIVFSNTLKQSEGRKTRIVSGDVVDQVRILRQQPGKTIAIGSLSIASQLFRSGLIDEYHVVIHPIVAGKGPRLFEGAGLEENLQLTLLGSKTFRSGVVALRYGKTIS